MIEARRQVGLACITSSQIFVGDPRAIDEMWEKGIDQEAGSLEECYSAGTGTVLRGSSVVSPTGVGSGVFPVYQVLDAKGNILRLEIILKHD